MAKKQTSFRFSEETVSKLESLAAATGRDKTFLASEAIERYYDIEAWQINAIQKGIKSLNEGKYITHEDLKKKWETKRENYLGSRS